MVSDQLREWIIIPTLQDLKLYSKEACDLLLGTCKQESNLGYYLAQIKGPARGIYQCEPATLQDVWTYIKRRQLMDAVCKASYLSFDDMQTATPKDRINILMSNLRFATCIARIHYLRIGEPIPLYNGDDKEYINSLAAYYKKYYNTYLGAAEMEQIIENFKKVITLS